MANSISCNDSREKDSSTGPALLSGNTSSIEPPESWSIPALREMFLFNLTCLRMWSLLRLAAIANIQVLKTVKVFGFVTALGNIIYGSIYEPLYCAGTSLPVIFQVL